MRLGEPSTEIFLNIELETVYSGMHFIIFPKPITFLPVCLLFFFMCLFFQFSRDPGALLSLVNPQRKKVVMT